MYTKRLSCIFNMQSNFSIYLHIEVILQMTSLLRALNMYAVATLLLRTSREPGRISPGSRY